MRPDLPPGSVVIDPDTARELLRPLVVGLAARVRADGGTGLSTRTLRLLQALHTAAETPRRFADEPDSGEPATVETGVRKLLATAEVAALLGCTPKHVRHLARTGRLPAHRIGRAWVVDRADLDHYRHGGDPGDTAARAANS